MSNYQDSFPSKWLSHKDLPKPRLVTVKKITEEEVGTDMKPVAYFHGEEKALGLNLTNCRSIAKIAHSDDVDQWEGTTIVIYKTQTDYQGKEVDCVRIRVPKEGTVAPEQEELPPDDDVPF